MSELLHDGDWFLVWALDGRACSICGLLTRRCVQFQMTVRGVMSFNVCAECWPELAQKIKEGLR